jgi:hypothetical protein
VGPAEDAYATGFFPSSVGAPNTQDFRVNTIRLTASTTKLVRDEADLDEENEAPSLAVPAVIFRNAVALAEATNRQFKAPQKQFFAPHCREFVRGLSLAAQQEVAPPSRQSKMTSLHQLQEFFHAPFNKRWLEKLTRFVAESKGFTVEN